MTKELDLIKVTEKKFQNRIQDQTKMMTNCFDFSSKSQVYSNSKVEDLSRLETMTAKFQQQTLVKVPIKKPKREIEQAPVSIVEKSEIAKYNEEKHHIFRRPTTKLMFDIPTNLGLGGIAEIDMQTNQGAEDYFTNKSPKNQILQADTTTSSNNNQSNIPIDDFQDFQTPLDVVKSYNVSHLHQNSSIGNLIKVIAKIALLLIILHQLFKLTRI